MEQHGDAALVQMVWRHPLAGVAGRAIAVPGALFTAICLATGSMWGRPTWGTWWEWDGRMTSMLVLLFLYFGYIALARRQPSRAAATMAASSRVPAIFGLVGAVNMPIINRIRGVVEQPAPGAEHHHARLDDRQPRSCGRSG
jgi:heme exporter protein C